MFSLFFLITICSETTTEDTKTGDTTTGDAAILKAFKENKLTELWPSVQEKCLDFNVERDIKCVVTCQAYDSNSDTEYLYEYTTMDMNLCGRMINQVLSDYPGYETGEMNFKDTDEVLKAFNQSLDKIQANKNRTTGIPRAADGIPTVEPAGTDQFRTNITMVDESKYEKAKKVLLENKKEMKLEFKEVHKFFKTVMPQIPLFIPLPEMKESDKPITYFYTLFSYDGRNYKTRLYRTSWNAEKGRAVTEAISGVPISIIIGYIVYSIVGIVLISLIIYGISYYFRKRNSGTSTDQKVEEEKPETRTTVPTEEEI